jgi:hypothetical protein
MNKFTFTEEHINYKRKNILHEGGKGLAVLVMASIILFICYLIGSINI